MVTELSLYVLRRFGMQFTSVTDKDIEIIMHSRKTLLFDKSEPWVKRGDSPCLMSQWAVMMELKFVH